MYIYQIQIVVVHFLQISANTEWEVETKCRCRTPKKDCNDPVKFIEVHGMTLCVCPSVFVRLVPCLLSCTQDIASPRLQVRALYSFQAEEADELEFSAGDIIQVLECSDPTWWKGQLRGRTGLFPSSYATPI